MKICPVGNEETITSRFTKGQTRDNGPVAKIYVYPTSLGIGIVGICYKQRKTRDPATKTILGLIVRKDIFIHLECHCLVAGQNPPDRASARRQVRSESNFDAPASSKTFGYQSLRNVETSRDNTDGPYVLKKVAVLPLARIFRENMIKNLASLHKITIHHCQL